MRNEAGKTMTGLHVDIRLSSIWQMTSTVIRCGSSCLVVDPGHFPREIDEIARSTPKGAAVDDFPAYRRALKRLIALIDRGIETVIPGHGPALCADDARRIAREDLRYLDAICRSAERQDPTTAREIPLPRAVDTEGMRGHHLANLAKAGLLTL
jgi:glyoxylase-like metal-dependent hydrolase (beta-lactamase superfamily II)